MGLEQGLKFLMGWSGRLNLVTVKQGVEGQKGARHMGIW